MGIALPQVVTEDRASGAQMVDGSLKFDSSQETQLSRTPSSAGNRRTWTWSGWVKKQSTSETNPKPLFTTNGGSNSTSFTFRFDNSTDDVLRVENDFAVGAPGGRTSAKFRDYSGWLHVVLSMDTTQASISDGMKIYVNGTQHSLTNTVWTQNIETNVNSTVAHFIGGQNQSNRYLDGMMSQVYVIDGQALGPESFGYTDPLTNTWRPKKYEGTFGIVGDYVISGGSNYSNREPSDMFDGSTSTYWQAAASGDRYQLMTFATPKTGTTIELSVLASNGWDGFEINGSVPSSLPGVGSQSWFNITTHTSGSLSSIRIAYTSGVETQLVYALRIDGTIITGQTERPSASNSFYLPMDGNSPIGEDKSGIVTPNDGTTWSQFLTSSSGFRGSEPATNAFDGDTSSICSAVDDGTITFTSPVTFASDSTIKVVVHGGNHTVTVNGGADQTISAGSLQSVTYSNSGNATFIMTFKRDTSADTGVRAIEINGVILTDGLKGNSWTPVNFGGSVALPNPQVSGARPILNVTQGGTQAGVGVFGSRENVGYAVTVYNDGGGNKYYIDGTKQATLTGLIRGATYTFNQTDSSNDTHPLVFGTTANGNDFSNGVNITGSPGSTGITSITIPYNAPNTLYYHCSAHANMGDSITGITTNEKLADQYASNCVLAVPFVGSTDDASAGLACTSTTKADTNSGSTATNTLSNFYSGSRDFDGSNDTCSFASVPACGAGDWTVEFWLYSEASSTDTVYRRIVSTGTNATSAIQIGHIGGSAASGGYITYTHSDNSVYAVNTSKVTDRWAHIAVVRESGSVNVYTDGIKGTTADSDANDKTGTTWYVSGYGGSTSSGRFNGKIQDLRVYPGVAKYTSDFVVPATNPDILPDTPSGVSGGSKLTISPDTSTEGAVAFDGNSDYLAVTGPGTLAASSNWCIECTFYCTGTSSGTYRIMSANESAQGSEYFMMRIRLGQYQFYTSNTNSLTGTAAFGKWTHIAMTKSGTTVRAYVDGVQLWSTTDNNTDSITNLITGWGYGSEYFPGFISNARFVNGSSVYTSNFTPPVVPLTNITNTAYLFCQSNTSATAYAVSPGSITANGTAAASRFTPFNTDINTVRGQETGYPTWNPLTKSTSTLSNGNLTITTDGGSGYPIELVNTFTPKGRGQWYWEFVLSALSGSNYTLLGMLPSDSPYLQGNSNNFTEAATRGFSVYVGYDGSVSAYSGAATAGSATATTGVGDVVGWAYDAENGTLKCFINGVSQGTQFTNIRTDVSWLFGVTDYDNSATASYTINFGQKPFKFPPPAGFQPLNAANVKPVKVITRPDQFVSTVLWTGNSTARSIVTNNAPDFVWTKLRNTGNNHKLFDSVRGIEKRLESSTTNGESTESGTVTSFNSDGFSLGTAGNVNGSYNYVAWCWKAGGSKGNFNVDDVGYASAAAAGITGGTITPTGASVGTKQGFSIIKYTGTGSNASVSHGLQNIPQFIIVKDLDSTSGWWSVYHHSMGNTHALYLNDPQSKVDSSFWNDTTPTSSVFTIGANANTNSSNDFISYLWHDVPGLQKFGGYSGNGSATDGTFIELGFKPAVVIIKNTVGYTEPWLIFDNQRNTHNPTDNYLYPNLSAVEADDYYPMDFLSNGFKLYNNAAAANSSGNSAEYIYAAWAEAPTFNLYGAQSNAR